MTQFIEDVLPPIQSAGLNTQKNISTTGTLSSGAQTVTGANTATGSVKAGSGTAVTAGGSTTGLLISSVANLGVFVGSGVPTLSAAQGSLYLRTDGSSTSTRLYVNTNGTTGWTNVTTAT